MMGPIFYIDPFVLVQLITRLFVAITVRTVKFHVSQPGELINSRESVALKLLILLVPL